MPKKVIEILPNITPDTQVLLFHQYVCIEHYPKGTESSSVGLTLGEQLSFLDLAFPDNCNYVFYRFRDKNITIKDYGNYVCIIIKKH